MLIAYWLLTDIIIYSYLNSESIQSRPVRLNPVQSGPVQITWYYTFACIRVDSLQITKYDQVPWANPVLYVMYS